MIKQELAIKLARNGVTRRWDPQVQVVYDDRRVPAYAYVAERLRRYDSALFLRFNALAERWELFRWRVGVPPSPRAIRRLGAEEMARRSMFLWTVQNADGSYCEPDARTIRKIQDGDLFAKCGSSSSKVIADAMDEADKKQDRRDKLEREEASFETARRMAHQVRAMTGHHKVFSHSR